MQGRLCSWYFYGVVGLWEEQEEEVEEEEEEEEYCKYVEGKEN